MEYGFLSLLPPIIAIILAIVTKQVTISLFMGIFLGELILNDFSIFGSIIASFEGMVELFKESWITKTFIFALFVGSILTLIVASGGVAGFVEFLTQKRQMIKSKRGALTLGFIIGVVIFIESSITSLIAGAITRPISDKFKTSREKLAYVCDSTSAPICSMIPLNAWGALLSGLIATQITAGVISGNSIELLIEAIPFNFYAIVTLLMVLYIIYTEKDFGSMKRAEIRAKNENKLFRDGAEIISKDLSELKSEKTPDMLNMILPITLLTIMVPIGLYLSGDGDIFKGSGSTAVFYAVIFTIFFSAIYYIYKRVMNLNEFLGHVYKGAGAMIPIVIILVFAFAIGDITQKLETGKYVASLVEGNLNPIFAPALIFLVASIISFSTGTSWGTFSIMMPIAIQMSVASEASLILSISAVISGGIFGDHCSPISDTTIVSSMATSCDHIDHVNTQLPYALVSGVISLILFVIFAWIM